VQRVHLLASRGEKRKKGSGSILFHFLGKKRPRSLARGPSRPISSASSKKMLYRGDAYRSSRGKEEEELFSQLTRRKKRKGKCHITLRTSSIKENVLFLKREKEPLFQEKGNVLCGGIGQTRTMAPGRGEGRKVHKLGGRGRRWLNFGAGGRAIASEGWEEKTFPASFWKEAGFLPHTGITRARRRKPVDDRFKTVWERGEEDFLGKGKPVKVPAKYPSWGKLRWEGRKRRECLSDFIRRGRKRTPPGLNCGGSCEHGKIRHVCLTPWRRKRKKGVS